MMGCARMLRQDPFTMLSEGHTSLEEPFQQDIYSYLVTAMPSALRTYKYFRNWRSHPIVTTITGDHSLNHLASKAFF